ncbi:MAG: sel1 repeat family protein [Pedosphaera sp.]|nr:sel1 repeat family protein [Pedosphaera sp.]
MKLRCLLVPASFSSGRAAEVKAPGEKASKGDATAFAEVRAQAEKGDAFGQVNLGEMYADGLGVAKDEVEAYKWWLLAGAQGDELAKKKIPLIEKDLTATQRLEGQRLAREWKPKK